jgi:hypothetical protein
MGKGVGMVLLVSYDLRGYERPSAYAIVQRAIEEKAVSYKKPLYSQWLVETAETPARWRETLLGVMDSNDSLFICRILSDEASRDGWIAEDIWFWLRTKA